VVSSSVFDLTFFDAFNPLGVPQQELILRPLENGVVIGIGN